MFLRDGSGVTICKSGSESISGRIFSRTRTISSYSNASMVRFNCSTANVDLNWWVFECNIRVGYVSDIWFYHKAESHLFNGSSVSGWYDNYVNQGGSNIGNGYISTSTTYVEWRGNNGTGQTVTNGCVIYAVCTNWGAVSVTYP